MSLYSGQDLGTWFRSASNSVRHRLWIASPYIGGWQSVRCLLGREWWDRPKIDVRLLTDEGASPNGQTLSRFAQKGRIRHVAGLHAKIYIFDDKVLLSSANLTCAAFTQRYEAAVWLKGTSAASAIALYEKWWKSSSRPFDLDKLTALARSKGKNAGEDGQDRLPTLHALPPDPGDFGGHSLTNIFLDYPRFLDLHGVLAQQYVSVQRIWPKIPLNFEIDGFLDYLFRWHPGTPSKVYEKIPPRKLSESARKKEIKLYGAAFRTWAKERGDDGHWRLDHSKYVQEKLSAKRIGQLTKNEIRRVARGLQCMNDGRVRTRFLDNNSTPLVRSAWNELLHGSAPITERMSICAGKLHGFKRSSVQELLGFFRPKVYPLRNATVNCGMRLLGFDVPAH
ncbi:MAG: hypothetical protein KJZ84_25070 [Bryobacteraceae bacterium]|nr:hypothetical protein [Bryobacteraceae bacterium]